VSQPASSSPASADAFAALLAALREKRAHEVEAKAATAAAWALASENISIEAKTVFLRELDEKLWTATTLAEFARVFRELARNPGVEKWADQAIDVCGTGGDHSGSYNISTTVAFILAAAGVPVFKHGNRAITSRSGSADFLLANGIPLEAPDYVWRQSLSELDFAFFFAPAYHPAFKHVSAARKILADEGKRTIFNLLGPILNPGKPAFQLMGVFNTNCVRLTYETLISLKIKSALVVHCVLPDGSGLDELSVAGDNFIRRDPSEKLVMKWTAANAGLRIGTAADLKGADAAFNKQLLEALLVGKANAGLEGTVSFNAGAALWVAGEADDLKSGVREAKKLLTTGPVRDWLKRTREFFHDYKA
jgi:anthranilate phosphoribosyltransferase